MKGRKSKKKGYTVRIGGSQIFNLGSSVAELNRKSIFHSHGDADILVGDLKF